MGYLFELDLAGLLRDDKRKDDGSFEFHYFDPQDEVIGARETKLTVQEISALFITNDGVPVRRCLNDLHMALKDHADSPFYCYRALETVRWHLGNKVGAVKDKEQWEVLRQSLGVDRSAIEKVKKHADSLRHGIPISYRGDEWREIISITWDVVENYIRYLQKVSTKRQPPAR
jgi:hypothetical protein